MLQAHKVSKTVALPETVMRCLRQNSEQDENEPDAQSCATISGFLSSTNFTWYANGPRLEVVNTKNGAKVATWKFGSILKDTTTKVVCVSEIPIFNIDLPLLVIGLECALTGGSICIFDIITSKVLRVIQLKDKVTSVCVINGGDGIFSTLGPLQAFDGIVTVGMAGGDVYLIDLCRQSIDDARYANSIHEIKDELDACQITVLTSKDIEKIELHKQRAAQLGNHLAIHLNAIEKNNLPHFVLKGPSGEDRIHANKSEVIISALHYSSHLGSVLIGYNFGAFQLWNIINMELVYTSPVYEGNIPISHFAVQEPTDDPRIFCYVWAIYSNTEPYQIGFPVAVLYALNFECKEWHDGYGYLYERFQSCAVRFQNELCLPHHTTCNGKPKGGHCLRLNAFNKGRVSRNSMSESHEDALTICWAIWNIWCRDRCEHTLMSIFDLNQWYKEQLPATPDSNKYKSYMSYVSLSDLVFDATRNTSPVLDAHINEATINQFVGAQKLEEHYYPCTLAFECNACTECNIVYITSQGQQRAFLSFIETNGPLNLLKPVELFEESMTLGLTPLFTELPQVISITFQREQILSIILEQQMVGCLCKCASSWSNGSYTSAGCSLEFFLSWAWNRALVLKANADKLCVHLFDYSAVKLDANSQRMLNNCSKQLSNLSIVYEFMCTKLNAFLPNTEVVHQQWNCVHLVSVYLEVLQWLLNVGLLPEYHMSMHKEMERLSSLGAPYPVDSLLEYYNERREYLQILNKQKNSTDRSLLFVDNLIDLECGGDALHKHWRDDGGNGFYPPQSLQALLLTYLVDDAELMCKHCVIFYVFLDLAMALDQERYKMVISHLIKFPAVFKLSPSIIKITQAFWQLDHGDFETAMELLLDAHIYTGDLKMWHHRIVLNALLVQGQHNFALLYLQVRRPPLTDVEDLYKAVSLFVCNNLLDEAIYYQRHNSTKENEVLLLRHIFEECDRNNQMKQLISYGLSQCEERALMKYLEEVNHPDMEQFQVIYYLQQSRYMDIFEMQGNTSPRQLGLVGQRKMNFKEGMVKTLSNFFPKISRNLINVCRQERQNLNIKSDRPKPMSVAIHDIKDNAKYKSTLIHGIMKARETWADTYENEKLSNEGTPFLRTPVITPVRLASKIPIISQKLINPDVTNLDDSEMAPSKKLKLIPRQSLGSTSMLSKSFFTVSSLTHLVRLDSPIVKRKLKKPLDSIDLRQKFSVCTPQSILKVRNLISHASYSGGESPTLLQASPEPASPSKILKISPRRSLTRSIVRFEKQNNSTTSSDTPRKVRDESGSTLTISGASDESTKKSTQVDIKKTSSPSTDEIYYSPESSLKSTADDDVGDAAKSKSSPKSTASTGDVGLNSKERTSEISTVNLIEGVSVNLVDSSCLTESKDTSESSPVVPEKRKKYPTTPRSRRSYRDQSSSSSDSIQTRSRTRITTQKLSTDLSPLETPKKTIHTPSKVRISASGGVRGRKSLSRQVLENNAYATMLSPANANGASLSASHTVEKHHMHVEKSSPDLKKMIAEFSKYVSDLSVKIGDADSERTSLIHTEVQNSASVQVLEASDDESLSITDTSDLDISMHSLGLPSFILNRPISLPSTPVVSEDKNPNQQQETEASKLSRDRDVSISNAEVEFNENASANERNNKPVGNKKTEVVTADDKEQSNKLIDDEKDETATAEQEVDVNEEIDGNDTLYSSENPLENNIYLMDEQEDENLNEGDDKTTEMERAYAKEQAVDVTDENIDDNTGENPLESNIYLVEEQEDENLNEDDGTSETGIINDNEQAVDVTDLIDDENVYLQSDNIETPELSENPLENNVYFVDEQEDDNLNVSVDEEITKVNTVEESEQANEVEIVDIIEISDTSEESGTSSSLRQSSDSKESNEGEEEEEDDDDDEDDDGLESDVESNDSTDELADSEETDKDLEEEPEEHNIMDKKIEEENLIEPQNNAESNISHLEEPENNTKGAPPFVTDSITDVNLENQDQAKAEVYEEAPPSVTDLNLENQDQAKAEMSGSANSTSTEKTDEFKSENLNGTDVLDRSLEAPPLEITRVDVLDVTDEQKPEEITADLSCEMQTTSASTSKDPVMNKTDVLDKSTPRLLLEITSVDVLDATPKSEFQRIADNAEALRKNEDKNSGNSESVKTPPATRLRKRVSSCDLETRPSKSVQGTRNRKRSASVHEAAPKTEPAAEDVSNKAKKENVTVLQPKRRLRSSSTSDVKQSVSVDVEVNPSSRNRRAASVSGDAQPIIGRKRGQRTKSIQNLPTIEEHGETQKLKQNKDEEPPRTLFDEYSTSRRLTRRQKSILERSRDAVEAAGSSFKDLDKSNFEKDKIDIDEAGIENSSQSTVTEESIGGNLRKRRQSQDSVSSVISTVASASDLESPKRRGRARKLSTSSAASSDRQLRSSSSPSVNKKIQAREDPEGREGRKRKASVKK